MEKESEEKLFGYLDAINKTLVEINALLNTIYLLDGGDSEEIRDEKPDYYR